MLCAISAHDVLSAAYIPYTHEATDAHTTRKPTEALVAGASEPHHAGASSADGAPVNVCFVVRISQTLIGPTPGAADGVGRAVAFTTALFTSAADGRALLLPAVDLDLDLEAWG